MYFVAKFGRNPYGKLISNYDVGAFDDDEKDQAYQFLENTQGELLMQGYKYCGIGNGDEADIIHVFESSNGTTMFVGLWEVAL